MPLFEKVIQESATSKDLKNVLSEKLREQKMREMDEAAVDRTVQQERTKEAELIAREEQAKQRQVEAQVSIADKYMPQGMWGFLGELLKGKSPQQALTVQDMLSLLEYAKGQQVQAVDQPSEGMWGFLGAMITQMSQGNKQVTPLEIIDVVHKLSPPPQSQQVNPLNSALEIINAFAALKNVFSPPQANPSSSLISLPGGAAIPLDQLMAFQNHSFNLELKKGDFEEKMKNAESVRKNIPAAIEGIKELAQAIRTAPPAIAEKSRAEIKGERPVGQDMNCPECGLIFTLPASFDGEVVCPSCASKAIKEAEAANAAKHAQERSQGKGKGKQARTEEAPEPSLP